MDKKTKWIRTREDWIPSYRPLQYGNPLPYQAVRVSFMRLTDGLYRVCVWGSDDFGLEKDQRHGLWAKILYMRIGHFTTQRQLKRWGFVHA